MARYEVVIEVARGPRVKRMVRARCADAAYQAVRSGLIETGVEPGALHISTVRQRRLLHRPMELVGGWNLGDLGDGDDGSAGVREPRRPLPNPPSLRMALDEPREPTPSQAPWLFGPS